MSRVGALRAKQGLLIKLFQDELLAEIFRSMSVYGSIRVLCLNVCTTAVVILLRESVFPTYGTI